MYQGSDLGDDAIVSMYSEVQGLKIPGHTGVGVRVVIRSSDFSSE